MKRPMIAVAFAVLGVLALSSAPASAQQPQQPPPTVIVPAPSAAPSTLETRGASGTTIMVPLGSSVTVTPPPAGRVVPTCAGAYNPGYGSNFATCTK